MSDLDRFWSRVQEAEWDECWIWLGGGGVPPNDYGRFRAAGRTHLAHRYAYQEMIGPIPDGLQLDHLCRTKRCVNPYHLDPVTLQVNVGRGRYAQATHCKYGHPFDGLNTRRTAKGRMCRRCAADREATRRANARAAFLAGDLEVDHGTAFAYQAGCHCDVCRSGNTRRFREYRRQRRQSAQANR